MYIWKIYNVETSPPSWNFKMPHYSIVFTELYGLGAWTRWPLMHCIIKFCESPLANIEIQTTKAK